LKPIRVLLVDDYQIVREGLRRMLEPEQEIDVVGQASSGEEALIEAQRLSPDVILMDMKMPGMGGIEAIRQLKEKLPNSNIIVMTVYDDRYLAEAAEAGAVGYLLKDISRDELVQAIRTAHQGQSPCAPSVTRTLLTQYADLTQAHRTHVLTPRQLQILQLIADGITNKDIATKLFLSEATVKRETSAIFVKLHVSDRAQAVAEAHKRHLL
jgi:DNA-binding NarL/FixJ family response regulator